MSVSLYLYLSLSYSCVPLCVCVLTQDVHESFGINLANVPRMEVAVDSGVIVVHALLVPFMMLVILLLLL